jgi:hypothetical protein
LLRLEIRPKRVSGNPGLESVKIPGGFDLELIQRVECQRPSVTDFAPTELRRAPDLQCLVIRLFM